MMPLGMASVGDVNIIKKISGRDEVRQHLAEMGFVVGAEVTVVSELGGNLILNVKESRVALDKTMAMRIMVWAAMRNERLYRNLSMKKDLAFRIRGMFLHSA